MLKLSKVAAAAWGLAAAMSVSAGEVEVLHYWTSGGEAKSAAELKKIMQAKGHTWRDFAVAGGGGDSAMTVLKSRVISGNPPSAAQVKGPAIQEWASEGVLANVDALAKAEKWDDVLPKVVADVMKYKGSYVAAPVNVHRVNWLWASSDALKKAGVVAMPKNWDEFFAAADKLKAAGLVPVAHGGQNWQDFTTFESVVLGVGGARFYQDALVKLDGKALGSDTMKKSLETFRRIKTYTDPAAAGRDWNLATAMLIQGKAGFQLMGDWAKGEFLAAGSCPPVSRLAVMKGGVVQQLGSPDEIYNRPSNTYVATFIGSPTMNLLRGTQAPGQFSIQGATLDLPAPQAAAELLLGVRPEHLVFDDRSPWRGQVSVVEPTGPDTYVMVDTAAGGMTLRTDAQTRVQPGDHVGLALAPAHAHWFDAGTENRLA